MRTSPVILGLAFAFAAFFTAQAAHPSRHHHTAATSLGQSSQLASVGVEIPFKSGREYRFQYNAQTLSGYVPWISTQQSASRLQASVRVIFQSPSQARLQLENVKAGQVSSLFGGKWADVLDTIQPMNIFESVSSGQNQQLIELLQLPCEFSYNGGLVEQIRFPREDIPWSKNIKKAVLNLVQLKLNSENIIEADDEQQLIEEGQRISEQPKQTKSFTTMEKTIEGDCECLYTVSKAQQIGQVNITKSIDFQRCKQLADVGYGFQADWTYPKGSLQQDILGANEQLEQQQQQKYGSVLPKEKLDRSTTIRYVLSNRGQQQEEGNNYGIQRVELKSGYAFKSSRIESSQAMQTTVLAELVSLEAPKNIRGEQKQIGKMQEEETLLYNAEFEMQEKRFFMYGDEKFAEEKNWPFRLNHPAKASQTLEEMAQGQVQKLVEIIQRQLGAQQGQRQSGNKQEEMEGDDRREIQEGGKLVHLLRMCSTRQLKAIEKSTAAEGKLSQEVFRNALSLAATRNTIKLLVEKLQNEDIEEMSATQLLRNLGRGLPAPSDRQLDLILGLCKSNVVIQKKMLKQSCWLTFGAIVGELNQQTRKAKNLGQTETPMKHDEICPKTKMDLYREVLVEQYKNAQTLYEKVLALKAIGNAGLVSTLEKLQIIINNQKESPLVRIQAIDSLRRLRYQMAPQRLQNLLMPVYQNTNEKPEVRMACFSMLMQLTAPSKQIIDQIIFTLDNEKCKEVKSFVYTTLKTYSFQQSPVREEQKIAEHIKDALKLCKIDEEEMRLRSSYTWKMPLFSQQQQEGIFFNFVSMFFPKSGSTMPSLLSFRVDTLFNEQFNRDTFSVAFVQKNIEQIAKQLFSAPSASDFDDESSAKPTGFFAQAGKQLRAIFSKLSIKGRNQQDQHQGQQEREAFVAACLRIKDVDVLMLPLAALEEDFSSPRTLQSRLVEAVKHLSGASTPLYRANAIAFINGRKAKVPTSVGMPLTIHQAFLVVGRMQAEIKTDGQKQNRVQLRVPALYTNFVQVQVMQVKLTPNHATGVASCRGLEINLPLDVEVKNGGEEAEKTLKVVVKLPQEKLRLLTAHSLPVVYSVKSARGLPLSLGQRRIATVQNEQLQNMQREIHTTVGDSTLQLPLHVHGYFHVPRRLNSVKEVLKVIMSSDNHVQVDFVPVSGSTPRQIQFGITTKLFLENDQKIAAGAVSATPSKLQQFYAKFQDPFFSMHSGVYSSQSSFSSSSSEEDQEIEYERSMSNKGNKNLQHRMPNSPSNDQYYNNHMSKYESEKTYKHQLKLTAESIGGQRADKAEALIEGVCDSKFHTCQTRVQLKRTPMLAGERSQWKMDAQMQTVYPHSVNQLDELLESINDETKKVGQHQRFFCQLEAEWGQEQQQKKQFINVNIQGEPSPRIINDVLERTATKNKQQQQSNSDEFGITSGSRYNNRRSSRSSPKLRPFLDRYMVVAEYKISPSISHNVFQKALETLKATHFWSTTSKVLNDESQQRLSSSNGQQQTIEGQLKAYLSIDPITHRYANISMRTPSQEVRMRSIQLPMHLRPMPLVRQRGQQQYTSQYPAHSVDQYADLVMKRSYERSECKVKNSQVETFDGVVFKAPMSKCYTVLAKDCSVSSDGTQVPKFAVLMKNIQSEGEEKKLKVITHHMIVEVRPVDEQKLEVVVNGKAYNADQWKSHQQRQQLSTVERGIEFQTNKSGRQSVVIEVGSVAVKFNGKSARILLSEEHKSTQCGLCGNYDDQPEDELRMNDGELTSDVKKFHRAYTLQEDEECKAEEQQRFYDHEQFGYGESRQQMANQQEVEPVELTMTVEYNHKICFSMKPVRQCPEGWYSGEEESEKDLLKRKKVEFTCLDRSTIEAKTLKGQVRKNGVVEMPDYTASFMENIVIPKRCIQY